MTHHRDSRRGSCHRVFASLAVLGTLGLVGCSADDPDPVTRTVQLDFVDEVADGHNHTRTVDDSGVSVQYGTLLFEGAGTLDGEPVDIELQADILYENGTGPAGGYLTVTAEDGAELVFDLDLEATRVGDGVEVGGRFVLVAGTGRFEDVTGFGSGAGRRDAQLGAGVTWTAELTLTGLDA